MKNNITRAAVTLLLTFIASATAWADPDLVIRSTADWNTFANSVNNGTSYQGQTVVLAADISVTTIVGSRSGTQPFDGTFDGCGHTLNLDLTVIDYYTAPFGAIQGATIKNLKTTGTVTGSMHSSGLVGIAHETNLIQNCEVAVSVVCSGNTHTHCGGILGHGAASNTTIRDCLFSGSISGATEATGIIYGWANSGNHTIINCLAAGTYTNCGGVDMIKDRGTVTVTNCYKTQKVGSHGTYTTATGETLRAQLGNGWEVSGNNVVPVMINSFEVPNVSYRAYNTTTQAFETLTANICRSVTSSTTTMGTADTETWYVVNNTVTVNSSRIEVLGTVNLILADGKTFRAEKGLHVPNGVTINIYGQSSGTGKLFCATMEDQLAGIGGNNEQTSGIITIHGGRIEAYGTYQSAAIGGGRGANGGTTTIYGGTINATGGYYGAGIGGGTGGSGGIINIVGGTLTAQGGQYGAGIGGGANGNGGTITIIGGTVIAQAGTVDGNDNSQAIGSGAFGSGGVLMLGDMKVYASAEATNPVTYANRVSTCHSKYAKLVPCTDHNYVNGVCSYCGAVPNVPVNYLAYQTATHSFVEQTVSEPTLVDEFTTTMGADNTETWYAVRRGVSNSNRIEVRGTVHLILCDGKTMTASKGITVNNGNSLSIYAQSGGTGVLNATGFEAGGNIYECAAIGSTGRTSLGDITIHGGRITATGVAWTAGIGGGIGSGEGSITIYGGTINASGIYSEAIGHGGGNNIASVTRTLIDGLRVTTGSNTTPVAYDDRLSGLSQNVARVEPCTEHHATTDHCDYCGIACYAVAYDGNNATGGTVPAPNTTYLPGETVTVLGNTGNLERTGYTFAGWNTAANGSGTSYTAGATFAINSSVTFYAKWTPITYIVRFHKNHNDATGTMSDLTLTYDVAQPLTTNAFIRNGYALVGWSTTANGTVAYTDGQSVSNLATVQDAVVNLYAQWTELYTIGYDLAGGSVATPNPTTYTTWSNAITLVNPTREGYTFMGWTGTDLTEPTMTVTIPQGSTGNRTYTATWAETYTITYDLAGGNVATPNPTTYTVLSEAITLNNPSRAGYYFAGWTGTDLTEATMTVIIPSGSTGNRAYTATWDAISGEYLAYNTTTGEFETLSFPTNTIPITSSTTTMGTNNTETWYIVDDNVTVNNRIELNGTVNMILADGKMLTAVKGLYVRPSVILNIYGQNGGTGELIAYSGNNRYAAIGGDDADSHNGNIYSEKSCGRITIHGGIITAKTYSIANNKYWEYGAGIGGGGSGNGGTITIHGGIVNAYGGRGAAGIGGGATYSGYKAGYGGTVTITGGTVTAIGGNYTSNNTNIIAAGGAGIGGGGDNSNNLNYINGTNGGGSGGTITISGGTVTAIGAKGAAGIGGGNKSTGDGGNITITGGTVIAIAGAQNVTSLTTSAQAIGRGEAASDEGTLTLGDMKAYVSDDATTPVALADRESTCRSSYAKLMPCTEHNFVNNVCTYCGVNLFHITYDGNGATGGTVPTDATHYIAGQTVTVLGNTGNLVQTGYTFDRWNTQADGLGTDYASGKTFIIDSSLTLYAKWGYAITYDLDGGTVATPNPTTYCESSGDITLNNPTRTNYEFTGWTGTDLTEPTMTVTIPAGSTGNREYTATWIMVSITLGNNTDNSAIIAETNGNSLERVTLANHTLYRNGDWNTLVLPFNLNSLTGTPLERFKLKTLSSTTYSDGTLTMNFADASTIEAGKPYIGKYVDADLVISSNADWNTFANNVNNGTESYEGKIVKLSSDISVSTMVGTVSGSTQGNAFKGTFDGCGHTLNVTITDKSNQGTAPFRYISDATIKNLKTTGTVTGNLHCSGLVGFSSGTTNTIRNCHVDVSVVCIGGNHSHCGGILGHSMYSATTIIDCLFSGKISSTTIATGIIFGWGSGATHTIVNCLAAGTYPNCSGIDMLKQNSGTMVATNSYKTQNVGSYGTYTTATGETLRALLGDGWEVINGDVVPKMERIPSNIVNPVFTNVTISDATTNVSTTYADFIGSYAPFNNDALLLDAHNSNGDAMHAAISISISDPSVPTGYSGNIEGWYSDAEKTIVASVVPFDANGNVTLYAKFPPITYTITYDLTGGCVSTDNPTNYTIESDEITLVNPTKEGYVFYGWIGSGLSSPTMTVTIPTGSIGNRSYTATWKRVLTLSSVADNNATIAATNGETIGSLFFSGYTLYRDGSWNTLCVPFDVDNLTGTPLEGATVKTLQSSAYDDGTLTMNMTNGLTAIEAGRPYIVKWEADLIIHNASEWDAFATNVNNGTDSYQGKTVKLANDISVTTMVGTVSVSTPGNAFKGTFDGCGHTLNVNITDESNQGTAPFRYISDATIKNLKTTGTVTGNLHCSGLVGFSSGTTNTIRNCHVAVSVVCSGGNHSHCGGILGHSRYSATTIIDCLFSGKISGTTTATGIIFGWGGGSSATHTIVNCLAAGTYTNCKGIDMLKQTAGTMVATNSYKTQNVGSYGTYTTATGETLRAQLGDGWEVINGNVVPKMPNTTGNIVNPVFTDVIISDVTANVLTTYADFIGSFAPLSTLNSQLSTLLDANNPDGDAMHAALSIHEPSVSGWFTDASRTIPFTTIPFAADGTVTLYAAHLTVAGYGSGTDKWVFIASPVEGSIAPTEVDNLIGTQLATTPEPLYDYDLYRFNQSGTNGEWENYHQHNTQQVPFLLENGKGYLYAKQNDVNLFFNGTLNTNDEMTVALNYDANAPHADIRGWNLVGNPFTEPAKIDRTYYKMNATGDDIEAVGNYTENAIPAFTGVMVKAESTEVNPTVTFTRASYATSTGNNGNLAITLSQQTESTRDGSTTSITHDKTFVSFNQGSQLGKFVFNRYHAKLYIPQGREDYSIAFSEKSGEMPLNFEASENGTYTITVNPEGVEMNYLHLIDNLTGANVDLLAQPSYTFEARLSDYASRFKLVYSAKKSIEEIGDNEPFAFIHNGEIIVESDGIVQVIDMMGRIIVQRGAGVHTVSTAGMAEGVYILRLIDGEKVRTQKTVIQ